MSIRWASAPLSLRDLGLCAALLATRLPFLAPGYGMDPDAWRVVDSAQRLARSGIYSPSRSPGYPVIEFANMFLIQWPAWTSNLLTAVLSVAAALLLTRHLHDLGVPRARWTGAAFMFVPVVFINSTVTLDYLWAMLFILAAWSCAHRERWLLAGLLLGTAMGCRLTSGVAGIALVILSWNGNLPELLRRSLLMAGSALMAVIAWYAPVYRAFGGFGFLTFVDTPRPIPVILFNASIGVWGIVGSLALMIAACSAIHCALRGSGRVVVLPRQTVLAAGSVVVLETLAFLRLPHEAAYLIPVVPFVLLLLPGYVTPFIHKLVLTMLVASSCIFGFGPNANSVGRVRPSVLGATFIVAGIPMFLDLLQGPVWVEHVRRVRRMRYLQSVTARLSLIEPDATVICGWLLPELRVMLPQPLDPRLKELPSATELQGYQGRHAPIYFLDGQDRYSAEQGVDLKRYGARGLEVAE